MSSPESRRALFVILRDCFTATISLLRYEQGEAEPVCVLPLVYIKNNAET